MTISNARSGASTGSWRIRSTYQFRTLMNTHNRKRGGVFSALFLLVVVLFFAILLSFAKFSNYALPEALRTKAWHASPTTGSAVLVQHACLLFLINALTLVFNSMDIIFEFYLQLLPLDRQHLRRSPHSHGGAFVRMLLPFPEQVHARNISITEIMSLILSAKS